AGGVLFWGISNYYGEGPKTEETAFLIEKGSGFNSIGARLEERGLIDNALLFRAGVWATKRNATVLPGQYLIPAKASMADILEIITETKPQEFFLNVIPGETSWQVAERMNDPAQSLTGDPIALPAEGSLLAVRHDFFPGDTRASLL